MRWISRTVPLGLQGNAKGGEKTTQLASLKQVSPFLQRILLRAKRKPGPEIMHPGPEIDLRCIQRQSGRDSGFLTYLLEIQGRIGYEIIRLDLESRSVLDRIVLLDDYERGMKDAIFETTFL